MVARLHELWLWVFHWPPNVGLCIALLAVAAVVMTTRDQPMRRREKICWIGLAFVLFLGEIYAMQTRQSDDAAARIAEDNRLAEILRQSQQQFEATMKKPGMSWTRHKRWLALRRTVSITLRVEVRLLT
jgi:hypothetical protein